MINWVSYTAKRTYLALSVKKMDIYLYSLPHYYRCNLKHLHLVLDSLS